MSEASQPTTTKPLHPRPSLDQAAYAAMWSYPYYFYPPEIYRTTYLNRSFPEHHWPFEHARHAIAKNLHDLVRDSFAQPRADIRESLARYYIDVELPGVESKDKIKVKWFSSRTLYVEVEKKAREVEEEISAIGGEDGAKQKADPTHAVHALVKERDLGVLKRAFYFPVAVDHETMSAKLHHGILEITLTKVDEQMPPEKHVEIEHE